MEGNLGLRTVTLKDLWRLLLKSFWAIILFAAIAVVGLFVTTKLYREPTYKSTATLYILRQDENSGGNTSSDFSLALNVVNDCDYLLKSHAVLDKVIQELDLNMSYGTLYNMISCYNPDGTRILEVTVTASSAQEAKEIVDSVCQIGTDKIGEAMGFRQVHPYELGSLSNAPTNTVSTRTYVLVAAVAGVAAFLFFLISYILDDKLRTEEDVQRVLGLTTLAKIPASKNMRSKKKYTGVTYADITVDAPQRDVEKRGAKG